MIDFNGLYTPASASQWSGRNDGADFNVQRWFQQITICDLEKALLPPLSGGKGLAILGFASDEGVRRNGGRTGAAQGPEAIRQASANLAVHFEAGFTLVDAGTICCAGRDLELAQEQLAVAVAEILGQGYRPLLWGGGHEMMYAHYCGIRKFLSGKKTAVTGAAGFAAQTAADSLADQTWLAATGINPETTERATPESAAPRIGVINFDAHFDLRIPGEAGATSGTGFWQVARDCRTAGEAFNYLALGIQKQSNTRLLYGTADSLNVSFVESRYFDSENSLFVESKIAGLLDASDYIYVTICLDVFAHLAAPGVSAPSATGILPDAFFMRMLATLLKSPKCISIDIAELNPAHDHSGQTAKLAAALSFEVAESLYS